jgi:hypothetical protein
MKKLNLVGPLIFGGSLLLQLTALCFQSHAAAGDEDLSFDPGSGLNGAVHAVAVQPAGKVINRRWVRHNQRPRARLSAHAETAPCL